MRQTLGRVPASSVAETCNSRMRRGSWRAIRVPLPQSQQAPSMRVSALIRAPKVSTAPHLRARTAPRAGTLSVSGQRDSTTVERVRLVRGPTHWALHLSTVAPSARQGRRGKQRLRARTRLPRTLHVRTVWLGGISLRRGRRRASHAVQGGTLPSRKGKRKLVLVAVLVARTKEQESERAREGDRSKI